MAGDRLETCATRVPQPRAEKGSQHWIQTLVNDAPGRLDAALGLGPIEWLSPLREDEYAEYLDEGFIERLGLRLSKRDLPSFWPTGGPRWDALGRTETGHVVLVEAKAHVAELFSPPSQASPASARRIRASLRETMSAVGAGEGVDWFRRFYQYANRLAHGCLLNVLNHVPATMAFVYFTGDQRMKGPRTRVEWEAAIAVLHEALGIRGKVPAFVKDVFIDVEAIRTADKSAQSRANETRFG